jgi:multidrug efflux pump subunit AcrB
MGLDIFLIMGFVMMIVVSVLVLDTLFHKITPANDHNLLFVIIYTNSNITVRVTNNL